MFKICTKSLVICLLCSIAVASEPYCVRNESTITRTPVTKTRQVIKKPTGAFKFFKQSKVYTEEYQDFEEHVKFKVIRSCCDGYEMSHLKMCEPICTSGCPRNAHCIEPNRCQCTSGYISAVSAIDGSHYCEPICNGGCPSNAQCAEPDVCECKRGYYTMNYRCEPRCTSGCPFGGICIFPDECQCLQGYSAVSGTCVPICTTGDGCLNGRCVENELCVCNTGYQMNPVTKICEKTCQDGICDDDYDNESELDSTTVISSKVFDEDQSGNDSIELDEGEKIFLSTTPSDYTDKVDLPDITTHYYKCPTNYVFYQNECRPQIFASNEVDCKFKPCVEHAFCQANGTCACIEGYGWYSPYNEEAVCLTLEEISAHLEGRGSEVDPKNSIDWLSGCFIVLGALCIAGALCFLAIKLLRHRNGKLEVEVKNDLYCTYDSKNSREVPHVL